MDNYRRDPEAQKLRDNHRAALHHVGMEQKAAVEKANAWRVSHAARLGVSVEEIGAAILRGWCGHWISELPASEVALLNHSPRNWLE